MIKRESETKWHEWFRKINRFMNEWIPESCQPSIEKDTMSACMHWFSSLPTVLLVQHPIRSHFELWLFIFICCLSRFVDPNTTLWYMQIFWVHYIILLITWIHLTPHVVCICFFHHNIGFFFFFSFFPIQYFWKYRKRSLVRCHGQQFQCAFD